LKSKENILFFGLAKRLVEFDFSFQWDFYTKHSVFFKIVHYIILTTNMHYKKKGCYKWAFKYSPRDKILSNDLHGGFQQKFTRNKKFHSQCSYSNQEEITHQIIWMFQLSFIFIISNFLKNKVKFY